MARTKKSPYPPVILVAAIQEDRGLGFQGTLLFQIRDDMKHFVRLTTGHTVVMGRKTWESIPEAYRPFKERVNIVVSRDTKYQAEGALVVDRFYKALEQAPLDKKIFVIGGGEIYKQALSYADTLELTIIHGTKEADAFFPPYESYFTEESRSQTFFDKEQNVSYTFVTYVKK